MSINTKKYIEEFIKIRDKSGNIVDFKLNMPQQKLYDIIKKQRQEGKPVRVIILKARQMGFSTLTEAILFKETATKFNIKTGIITHLDTATTNLFNMSKGFYDNLPQTMKPAVKNSNAKEIIFDNDEGTGLKSKIKCMTAGTSGVGRSDTFNNLHISELAFWQGDVKATLTGLFQAVPNLPNTMIIIESTANGFEHYKSLWDMAVKGESDFIPLFVGWNELDEYKMKYSGFELTKEEKELKEQYNLTNEQLEWRRWCIKNNCSGDIDQFQQEYPINPQEAFLTSGRPVFDVRKVIKRLEEIPKPIKTGYFIYDYDGLRISNIRWVNDPRGYIKIYHVPNVPKFTKYCIGGDTSGEGSDFFTASVLDAKTGMQVATLRHQFDEDLYTKQLYCLGMHYGIAMLAPECNFSSYPIKELERLGYPNMYVREREDTFTNNIQKSYGFRTTSVTRPVIIAELVQIVRENPELINDEDTLKEMLVFIKNEKGRPEAMEGEHDDCVMALAIAHYVRSQVIFTQEPIKIYPEFNFSSERSLHEDWGEEITPV